MPNIFICFDHTSATVPAILCPDLFDSYATLVMFVNYQDGLFYLTFPKTMHDKQVRLEHLYKSFVDLMRLNIDSPITLKQFLAFIQCVKQNGSLGIASDGWYILGRSNLGKPDSQFVSSLFHTCVQACAQYCKKITLYPCNVNQNSCVDAEAYLANRSTKHGFSLADIEDLGDDNDVDDMVKGVFVQTPSLFKAILKNEFKAVLKNEMPDAHCQPSYFEGHDQTYLKVDLGLDKKLDFLQSQVGRLFIFWRQAESRMAHILDMTIDKNEKPTSTLQG